MTLGRHLSLATSEKDDSVMDTLLRYGADLAVEESSGLTPGEYASEKNAYSATFKIKKCGKLSWFVLPFDGTHVIFVEKGIDYTEHGILKMLERGGNINWRDSQGNSLLHQLCIRKLASPIRFVIEV